MLLKHAQEEAICSNKYILIRIPMDGDLNHDQYSS